METKEIKRKIDEECRAVMEVPTKPRKSSPRIVRLSLYKGDSILKHFGPAAARNLYQVLSGAYRD